MSPEKKKPNYIDHWIHLGMWLLQVRLHTDDKLSPQEVLDKMEEIELGFFREKPKV